MSGRTGAANLGANTMRTPIRFGVLGAANISKAAIFDPCRKNPEDAVIAALAARDRSRAVQQKEENKLTACEIFDGYQDLLDRANIDAVYIPSPNGLHFEWTVKALRAGYHVLCEKPFSSNAEEARIMVQTAKDKGLVLMEAAHWFYHPFRSKMQSIIASDLLGDIQKLYANFFFPGRPGLPRRKKTGTMAIRYDASLAGGCMMDCGWYALNCVRTLQGRQVPEVIWAEAQKWSDDPEIDEGMKAGLRFQDGVEAEILCSYAGDGSDGFLKPTGPGTAGPPVKGGPKHPMGPMRWDAEITGSKAVMHCINYGVPHHGNRIIVNASDGKELLNEKVDSAGLATYDFMVLAFCSHVRQVRHGWVRSPDAFANTGMDPVLQMETVDRIYAKAGLKPRTGPAAIKSKL